MKKSISFILIVVICFCIFYGIRYVENPVETQTAISEIYENKIDTIVNNKTIYKEKLKDFRWANEEIMEKWDNML